MMLEELPPFHWSAVVPGNDAIVYHVMLPSCIVPLSSATTSVCCMHIAYTDTTVTVIHQQTAGSPT